MTDFSGKNDELARKVKSELPPVELFRVRCEADFYGASYGIARPLGRKHPPRSFTPWIHGVTTVPLVHPQQIVSTDRQALHLLANKTQFSFLTSQGYAHLETIGTGILYTDNRPIQRHSNSLLIVPHHTTREYSTSYDEDEYLNSLMELRENFSGIVACISPYCVKRGLWVESLRKRGIPWIQGAHASDRNALQRMRDLFSSFDFVTSNYIGSHIAYASFLGCKVSIFGQLPIPSREDLKNILILQLHPELLELYLQFLTEKSLKNHLPWAFRQPDKAELSVDWGKEAVGQSSVRDASEVGELLGWRFKSQIEGYSKWASGLPRRAAYWLRHGRFPHGT